MPKITNERYGKFFNKRKAESILIIPSEFNDLLSKIGHKEQKEARALAIILFYSGMRPSEALELKNSTEYIYFVNNPFYKEGSEKEVKYDMVLMWDAKKGGDTVKINLSLDKDNLHIRELHNYISNLLPGTYLFPSFRKDIKHKVKILNKKTGEIKIKEYEYLDKNLDYYFKKWFNFPPYFLRHNRFSLMMAQGETIEGIREAKGAKSMNSVMPYLHFDKKARAKRKKYYHYNSDNEILD